MTTTPAAVRRLRSVTSTEPEVPVSDDCCLGTSTILDDLARAGVIQHETEDAMASSPALTVTTALLSHGLELEQVRQLVSTAELLAQQVCEGLQATVADYGDEVAAECALNLAKLLCADALTTPGQTGRKPAPARSALRLVPRDS